MVLVGFLFSGFWGFLDPKEKKSVELTEHIRELKIIQPMSKTFLAFKKKVEEVDFPSTEPAQKALLKFFIDSPPCTAKGWNLFERLLKKHHRSLENFSEIFRDFWIEGKAGIQDLRTTLKEWGGFLTDQDHERKVREICLKVVMKTADLSQADDILEAFPKVFHEKHATRVVRMLLGARFNTDQSHLLPLFRMLYAKCERDPLWALACAKFLLTQRQVGKAFQSLRQQEETKSLQFVQEASLRKAYNAMYFALIRELVQEGNEAESEHQFNKADRLYDKASVVAEESLRYVRVPEVEHLWLAGFAYINAQNWQKALKNLQKLLLATMGSVWRKNEEEGVSVLSQERYQSKAAFWCGVCCQKMGQTEQANVYFRKASQYPFFFYGQAAMAKLNRPLVMKSFPKYPSTVPYKNKALQKAHSLLMDKSIDFEMSSLIVDDMLNGVTRPAECWTLLCALSKRFSNVTFWARRMSNRSQATFVEAYPTCKLPSFFQDPSLIFAISLAETAFNPEVVSRAGALGIMQVMPHEVPYFARKAGLAPSLKRMKEARYSMMVGIAEVKEKLRDFEDKYMLTIAAYNAGKKKALEWHGSLVPRREKDWLVRGCRFIESIPFEETRNYVARVISFYITYRGITKQVLQPQDLKKILRF